MVECHLAKVDVEGSNPFSRSNEARPMPGFFVSGLTERYGKAESNAANASW